MARGVVLVAVVLMTADAAAAQSMDVRGITDAVMTHVCGPFARDTDMMAAIGAADRLGYGIVSYEPDHIRLGAADLQPAPDAIELSRRRYGAVRLSRDYDRALCSVDIAEGGVGRVAAAAEPHLRALGMEPVLDDRDGRPALSVWRGEGVQAVIAPSPHHRPGVELILSIYAPEER